ncbi:MAG: hypothetical protein ABI744_06850 [Chloroflexota bacterium]
MVDYVAGLGIVLIVVLFLSLLQNLLVRLLYRVRPATTQTVQRRLFIEVVQGLAGVVFGVTAFTAFRGGTFWLLGALEGIAFLGLAWLSGRQLKRREHTPVA